ncbi:MAG: phytanoyl-CoA dioxygenase family protein [Flavobacteriales bacterium]|nr:phytanoyl-CoA dioxygenase family protein [Flavobacteriales bacterium]
MHEPILKEKYSKEGILFPISVLEKSDLSYFRDQYDALEAFLGEKASNPVYYKQIHFTHPWAYKLALHPPILDAIEPILGKNIIVHGCSVFCKQPNNGQYISWHQDGYYFDIAKPNYITAWIALSPSNAENGCMRVIPQTHTKDYPHTSHTDIDNMLSSGLTISEPLNEIKAVDVELKAGEMSLHHLNIIHSSQPNTSNSKRLGIAIRYTSPDMIQQLPHHDIIVARGKDEFNHFNHLQHKPEGSIAESVERQQKVHNAYMKKRQAKTEN